MNTQFTKLQDNDLQAAAGGFSVSDPIGMWVDTAITAAYGGPGIIANGALKLVTGKSAGDYSAEPARKLGSNITEPIGKRLAGLAGHQ